MITKSIANAANNFFDIFYIICRKKMLELQLLLTHLDRNKEHNV